MKVGIIGAGSVGRALGRALAKSGHEVLFGLRDPEKSDARFMSVVAEGQARIGTVAEAAAFGDALVLAVPWTAAREAIEAAGDLTGKCLLDATNPLLPGLAGLDHPEGASGGEQVAAWARQARVVKIFNTTGYENMTDPRYGEASAMMPYAGDDRAAKAAARQLAADIGFEPVDAGPLAAAHELEALALLWVRLAVMQGLGRDIAFALLRR